VLSILAKVLDLKLARVQVGQSIIQYLLYAVAVIVYLTWIGCPWQLSLALILTVEIAGNSRNIVCMGLIGRELLFQ
jgi:hypothetical protein